MKRFCLLLTTMVALTGAAFADSATAYDLGYCEGLVNKVGQSDFASANTDDWVSEAIFIPAEKMQRLAGNRIEEINAGTSASVNMDTLKVWIRTELDGQNLVEGWITKDSDPKLKKGWNSVALSSAFEITADCPGVYIGYSFFQKKRALGLSIVSPSDLATQPNALYVQLGTDTEWEDRHDEGTASIEAVVIGDYLPQYDLWLKSIDLPETFVIERGTLEISAQVKNVGMADVTGWEFSCVFDDMMVDYRASVEQPLSYGEEATVTFVIEPDCFDVADEADHVLSVSIVAIHEGDDCDASNNTVEGPIQLRDYAFERQVLIEEFTTEQCPNCPAMATRLHSFLETDDYAQKVNVVCHHSGYYTDWLTIPADNSYTWLYNMGGSTFAPAIMVDRLTSSYTSDQADNSPICFPTSISALSSMVDRRLKDDSYVNLKITANLPEDASEVEVIVTGRRALENFTKNPPRIVVGLIEDSIKARSQSGASGTYYQMHVNRAYNSTWGEVIEWDGDDYTYTCTLPVESTYNRDQLSILAYVWDYDSSSVPNCEICNSASLPYSRFNEADGIGSIANEHAASEPVAFYTLDGVQVSQPRTGLYIVRYADGSSRKVMMK